MFRRLHRQRPTAAAPAVAAPAHAVTSEYSDEICRFVLTCNCGALFATNVIDEALEWHELHMRLAPLNDELASMASTG